MVDILGVISYKLGIMQGFSPRIVVIGAGIVGASITHALARRGATVTLMDQDMPGQGVTARSFGWVNVNHGMAEAYHRLRQEAIEAWWKLDRDLGGGIVDGWRGAMVWHDDTGKAEAFVRDHLSWGYDSRLIARAEILAMEPALVHPPEVAAFSPSEGAVDPATVTRALIKAARHAGARIVERTRVHEIATETGRATAVSTDAGKISADVVVLAAGAGSATLVNALAVQTSPALLLRFNAPGPLIDRVLSGPNFEIRQTPDGQLLAAEDCPAGASQEEAEAKGRETLALIKTGLRGGDGLVLESVAIGQRPIPADGLPIIGFMPRVEGLYAAVMHAGVTLAPVIGDLAAAEILEDTEAPALALCRPGRFAIGT
jgi:glycine/D-amino acid oxidase-like deaminating enzyme